MTIQRIYPEPKTALINWIEQNFHQIADYVFTCRLSDGSTMTIHDIGGRIEALGLLEAAKDCEFKRRDNVLRADVPNLIATIRDRDRKIAALERVAEAAKAFTATWGRSNGRMLYREPEIPDTEIKLMEALEAMEK